MPHNKSPSAFSVSISLVGTVVLVSEVPSLLSSTLRRSFLF